MRRLLALLVAFIASRSMASGPALGAAPGGHPGVTYTCVSPTDSTTHLNSGYDHGQPHAHDHSQRQNIAESVTSAVATRPKDTANDRTYNYDAIPSSVRLTSVETETAPGAVGDLGSSAWPMAALAPSGVAAKTTPELASGLERTGTALSKSDAFHRSVSWVVDNPAAQRFAITGGDGVGRELYQLPGEVNGKSGVFEWIIDRTGANPVINHQRFIPGGSVTGFPNQVVP